MHVGAWYTNAHPSLFTFFLDKISSNRLKYAALSFSRSQSTGNGSLGTETVTYTTGNEQVTVVPDGFSTSNELQPGWRSNYQGDYKDQYVEPICTQDLLSWAFQVARGMEYLCQRKVCTTFYA